jgi:hypothetical protein
MDAFGAQPAPAEPTNIAQPAPIAVAEEEKMTPVGLVPNIPAEGLPNGWTIEQWGHYGQQYLDAQGSQATSFSQSATDLK